MAGNEFYGLSSQQYGGSGILDAVTKAKKVSAKKSVENPDMVVSSPGSNQTGETIKSLFNNVNARTPEPRTDYTGNDLLARIAREENALDMDRKTFVHGAPGSAPLNDNTFIASEDHNLGKGLYNPHTKLYGSKATRNNNQTNITGMGGLLYGASKIATSGTGDAGDQKQLVFDTPEQGWVAARNLMSSEKYNNAPIKDAFAKWQTDQGAWNKIKNELTQSGIDINKRFIDLSPEQKVVFMNNRARHEGYKGSPMNISLL